MHLPVEQTDCFLRFVAVADWAWEVVSGWQPLARDTLGKQLVRAADSIGANMVEGDGRYAKADSLHFFVVARGSARETRYWLERAKVRGLISDAEYTEQINAINHATRQLNSLINYRRSQPSGVKEESSEYGE